MELSLTFAQAIWFFPVALPICVWVALTDLRELRIPNVAVLAHAVQFLGAGLIVLPLEAYGFRLLQLVVVALLGQPDVSDQRPSGGSELVWHRKRLSVRMVFDAPTAPGPPTASRRGGVAHVIQLEVVGDPGS